MIAQPLIDLLLGNIAAPAGGNPDRSVAQAAIKTAVGKKVRAQKVLQNDGAPPYITVRQSAGHSPCALQGPIGTAQASILVICHHTDTAKADALADNVRKLFNGYATPSWQSPANRIRGIFLEDLSEDWDPDIHGGELGVFISPVQLKVWYDE